MKKLLVFSILIFTLFKISTAQKWYKGDLHCHSTYSDGNGKMVDVIKKAHSLDFDFFVVTDHDHQLYDRYNGTAHWNDASYVSAQGMTLLYGVEWTTSKGHANIWSDKKFDYAALWDAHQLLDPQAAINAAHAQNALFSVNHPNAYLCFPWKFSFDLNFDAMEVWNSMYAVPNFNGTAIGTTWDNVLKTG